MSLGLIKERVISFPDRQPDIETILSTVIGLLERLEWHPASAEGKTYANPSEYGVSLPSETRQTFETILRAALRTAPDSPTARHDLLFLLGGCRLLGGDSLFAMQAFLLCLAERRESVTAYRWLGHINFGLCSFPAAQAFYGLALAFCPDDPQLLRHLACLLYGSRLPVGVTLLERAVRTAPDYIEGQRNLARCNLAENRPEAALERYRRVVALAPDHAEAWRNIGNVLFAFRRLDEAESRFQRALRIDRTSATIQTSLADVLLLRGALDEAAARHHAAATICGRMPSAQWLDEAFIPDAISGCVRVAADLRPLLEMLPSGHAPQRDGLVAAVLGYTQGLCGDYQGSLVALDRAAASARGHIVLQLDWRLAAMAVREDSDDDAAFGAALAAAPAVGAEWLNSFLLEGTDVSHWVLGNGWRRCMAENDRLRQRIAGILEKVTDEAAAVEPAYRLALCAIHFKAAGAGPWRDHLRAWIRQFQGAERRTARNALEQVWTLIRIVRGRCAESDRLIAEAVLEDDDMLLVAWLDAFSIVGAQAGYADDWLDVMFARTTHLLRSLEGRSDLDDLLPHILLTACFLSHDDGVYAEVTAFWVARLRRWESWGRFANRVPATAASGLIRVGYVVHDFRYQDFCPEHNVLRLHDVERFDVNVYFASPRHSPWCRRLEGVPPLLRDLRGQVRSLNGLTPEDAAALIAADGNEVLFDTFGWWAEEIPQIFAQRPGLVQATWCGLSRPGKDGIIDYIIGNDDLFPPGAEDSMPERIVRVDGSYIPVKPREHALPATPRSLFNVPDDRFVFLGYHQVMKINGQTLDLWMEILRRCPDSVLILNWMEPKRVVDIAQRHGIDPQRILLFRFVKTEVEHLMRLGMANLFLDTTPFTSAGLTGVDAIYMGVPRITLARENLYSRFGMVLMNAVGLGDFVCHSREAFVDKAVSLYRDREALHHAKRRVAVDAIESEALDSARVLRKVELAARIMHDRHKAGLPPMSFRV